MTDAEKFYNWVKVRMASCDKPVDLKKIYDEFKQASKRAAPVVGEKDAANVGYTNVSGKS